jgi:HSP20 family protein
MKSFLPSLWSRNSELAADPFNLMRKEMDDFLQGLGRRFPSLEVGANAPAVDIAENKDGIEITAELPGVDAKDINISLDGNRLIISGEKKSETAQKDKDWQLVERSYGAFHRSIALPFEPKEDAVVAHFDKGVLRLTVKKPPEIAAKGVKKIEIKSGAPTIAPAQKAA